MIPKYHAERTHEIPDEYLTDIVPVASKVVKGLIAAGLPHDYNILQNNGRIAHQVRPPYLALPARSSMNLFIQ